MAHGTFQARLEELEAELLQMGRQVQAQLDRTLEAFGRGDGALAGEVIALDDLIDRAYVDVEQGTLRALALHAPIAGDLRQVAAILHVNLHLERMGDLCANIAKHTRATLDHPPNPEVRATIAEMGTHARKLIAAALTCYARRDAGLAESLPRLDEPLDRLNHQVLDRIGRAFEDEHGSEWASRMVLVARFLERLGDHAVDIGEQVGFVVTGEVREFLPPKSARGRVAG